MKKLNFPTVVARYAEILAANPGRVLMMDADNAALIHEGQMVGVFVQNGKYDLAEVYEIESDAWDDTLGQWAGHDETRDYLENPRFIEETT